MKIGLIGAKLLRANGRTDERTDITKVIDALHNFASTLKNGCYSIHASIWP